MSRFVNLEFGNEFEDQSHETGSKDEGFYSAGAQQAFEEGDFEKALRLFSKVLEFNPENTTAWTGQVRALIELGEFREAKLWADKALERFPHDPELLASKAVALGRSGDLDGALAFSDAAIEEHGDTPYIWLARGDVLLARAEPRADYCFDKALLLAPRDWFIAWLSARIRYFYKQFALAFKLAQQAVEWDPARSAAWLLVALCQKELGLLAPARVSLKQALELNPHCPGAHKVTVQLAQSGSGSLWRRWCYRLFGR